MSESSPAFRRGRRGGGLYVLQVHEVDPIAERAATKASGIVATDEEVAGVEAPSRPTTISNRRSTVGARSRSSCNRRCGCSTWVSPRSRRRSSSMRDQHVPTMWDHWASLSSSRRLPLPSGSRPSRCTSRSRWRRRRPRSSAARWAAATFASVASLRVGIVRGPDALKPPVSTQPVGRRGGCFSSTGSRSAGSRSEPSSVATQAHLGASHRSTRSHGQLDAPSRVPHTRPTRWARRPCRSRTVRHVEDPPPGGRTGCVPRSLDRPSGSLTERSNWSALSWK